MFQREIVFCYTGTAKSLTECRITCAIEEKDFYVYYFLKKHSGRTLIFCNSIGCVKRLSTLLSLLQCNTLPLHACMQQRQRLKNLERYISFFKNTVLNLNVLNFLDFETIHAVYQYPQMLQHVDQIFQVQSTYYTIKPPAPSRVTFIVLAGQREPPNRALPC